MWHALEVLRRELGVDGLARFLRLDRSGQREYTTNRTQWQKELDSERNPRFHQAPPTQVVVPEPRLEPVHIISSEHVAGSTRRVTPSARCRFDILGILPEVVCKSPIGASIAP